MTSYSIISSIVSHRVFAEMNPVDLKMAKPRNRNFSWIMCQCVDSTETMADSTTANKSYKLFMMPITRHAKLKISQHVNFRQRKHQATSFEENSRVTGMCNKDSGI